MLTGARLVVLVTGILIAVVGLFALAAGAVIIGIYAFVGGVAITIGVLIERTHYRSADAERTAAPPGPGGGEPLGDPLETRFSPTDEIFEDPTSGRRMRVWLDRSSGERRYVALE
jgi:hypothetical protein